MQRPLTDEITGHLRRGAWAITVNKRLSRAISASFDSAMAASGRTAWPTPVVVPLDSWLTGIWNDSPGGMAAPALQRHRALVIWEDIIASDTDVARGVRADARALAERAYSAYGLMRDFQIDIPGGIYTTPETRSLKRWSAQYESRLSRLGFTCQHTAASRAVGLIASGCLSLPGQVVLAGFDEPSGVVEAVFDAVSAAGAEAIFLPGRADTPPAAAGTPIRVVRCSDAADEVVRAARWIRETMRPGERVAVIVPELQRYRGVIEREFASELDPASVLPERLLGADGEQAVFNISLGTPLSDEPLVAAALQVIRVNGAPSRLDDLIPALMSPYVAGTGAALASLASVDIALRKENRTYVTLHELIRRLSADGRAPAFAARLERWGEMLRSKGRSRRPPSSWAAFFMEVLSTVGFASEVSLSSAEHQGRAAFIECVERFATLDDILGPIGVGSAVSMLTGIAESTIHQSESPEAEVQVLGLLESAGLSFDRVRMLGCHGFALPSPPSPNPFIPLYLQKEHDLPHSSHDREQRFARAVLERIIACTGELTASYPAVVDDRLASLSPLFSGLAIEEDTPEPPGPHRLRDAVFASRSTEPMPADAPLPATPAEIKKIRGGSGILKEQSACPFRAFATYRLAAEPVPGTTAGLHPMRRGTVAHNAMKTIWERLGDSAALKRAFDDGCIAAVIDESVASASSAIHVDPPLSAKYLDIEKKRLAGLIREYLDSELQRPPFRVAALESTVETSLSGLVIRGRIDRIDELASGEKVLIDYKTGRAAIFDWLPPRPADPQLPLYTTTAAFDAVAFATLRAGECGFRGVARSAGWLPGVKALEDDRIALRLSEATGQAADWPSLMAAWQAMVEGLAADFIAGAAEVDPNPTLHGMYSPCYRCGYTALCRVLDTSGTWLWDDGADDDEDGGGRRTQ